MCSFNCDNGGVQNLSFQDFFLNCTRFFFHCWRGGWFPTWSTQCRRPRIFIDFLNSLPLLPLVELHFSFFTSFNFLFTFLSWLFLFYWDFYEQALSNSINPLHQYSFHSSLSRWTRVHLKVGNRMYIHIPFIKLKLVPNQFFFRIFFPDWIHPTAIYIYISFVACTILKFIRSQTSISRSRCKIFIAPSLQCSSQQLVFVIEF